MIMKPIKYKDYIIRLPEISDAKALLNFSNDLVEENVDINRTKKSTLKEEKKYIKTSLKNFKAKKGIVLSAFKGKIVVGDAGIYLNSGKQSHISGLGISVAKEERGKKLGLKLMKEVMKLAKKNLKGIECIQLGVFKRNKVAINLYKKLGFKKVAELPKQFKLNNKYYAEIMMNYWIT